LDLLGFVARISQCLIMINKRAPPLQRKRGQPSIEAAATDEKPEEQTPRQKTAVQPTPLTEIRLDNVGHLPEHKSVKGRCQQCKTSIIRTSCIKCGVFFLCLTTDKNCYIAYHIIHSYLLAVDCGWGLSLRIFLFYCFFCFSLMSYQLSQRLYFPHLSTEIFQRRMAVSAYYFSTFCSLMFHALKHSWFSVFLINAYFYTQ